MALCDPEETAAAQGGHDHRVVLGSAATCRTNQRDDRRDESEPGNHLRQDFGRCEHVHDYGSGLGGSRAHPAVRVCEVQERRHQLVQNRLMVERTFDYAVIRQISVHPAVYPYVSDDFSDREWWEVPKGEQYIYLLASDETQ